MSSLPPPLPPPQPVPKKGLSGCAIAAIIIGVLVGIVVLGVGVGGYVFYKQAGGKAGVIKSTFAMSNPDYDILDLDDKEKTITVRHKKTGKTATIPISRLKGGHIDPGDLGMTPDEAEGTGAAPSWVKYPGAKQVSAAQLLSISTIIYQTDDPVETVMSYYKREIGNQGSLTTSARNGTIVIDEPKGSLQIAVQSGRGSKTLISVIYRKK